MFSTWRDGSKIPSATLHPTYGDVVPFLFLLFIVVPLVELFLLMTLGQWMGFWNTVLLILVTGITGAWLAKREGLRAFRAVQDALRRGEAPEETLASGLLLLVGGAFLVTPGVLTDLAGLFCLVPQGRRWLAGMLTRQLAARAQVVVQHPGGGFGPVSPRPGANPSRRARRAQAPFPAIIEVEGEETYRSS